MIHIFDLSHYLDDIENLMMIVERPDGKFFLLNEDRFDLTGTQGQRIFHNWKECREYYYELDRPRVYEIIEEKMGSVLNEWKD